MLKSKYSIHHTKQIASRQFTDRDEPRKAFENAINLLNRESYKVLVYYGVGGIGKSRLQKELSSTLDESTIKLFIDFQDIDHRKPAEALTWFKQQAVNNYRIKFFTFDLAYAIYWSKINPNISIKQERISIPFLEEGDFIAEAVSQLENLPIVQWIPRTLKVIDGLAQYKDITRWWNKKGKEILSELQNMTPNEIEVRLSSYWVADFLEWLKLQENEPKVVFFFDTYEALWENNRSFGNYNDKDEWVREFILQFEDSEILNVICGREKITWDRLDPDWGQVVEQHLMGELSSIDCKKFLNSCDITDELIQEAIIEGSDGLPYYLDLMVDTYEVLSKKGTPKAEEFSNSPNKVLERFLKYLSTQEMATLKVLSIPRFWSEELFCDMVKEFSTGYPPTSYGELSHFSFIQETDNIGIWSMHKLMKESLSKQTRNETPKLVEKINKYLLQYYSNELLNLNRETGLSDSFVEGLYHGEQVLDEEELIEWINTNARVLIDNGEWSCLIEQYTRLLANNTGENITVFLNLQLGKLYLLMGQYKLSEEHYIDARTYYLQLQSTSIVLKKMSEINNQLGELYRNTNEYDKGIQSYQEAIEYSEKIIEDNVDKFTYIAYASIKLGKLFKFCSSYDNAKQYYHKALDNCNKALTLGFNSSSIYVALGEAHEKLGELIFDEVFEVVNAEYDHLYAAIEAYEHALEDKNLENKFIVMINLGLAHKRLAEALLIENNIPEKLEHFQIAIDIYNKSIELAPDYVDGYERRGHAAVDLMELQIVIDRDEEALDTFNIAIDSFEKAINISEKQGSSLNRIGSAYRILGNLHWKQKNFSLAIDSFELALQKSEELMQKAPEYIYANNSRGKIYKDMALCYLDMGNQQKYRESVQLAIEHFEKTLKTSPNSKTALHYIEELRTV